MATIDSLVTDQYLAGFFDGEGCIAMTRRIGKARTHTLQLTVTNTDEASVRLFQQRFGGYVGSKPPTERWRRVFRWTLNGRRAVSVLFALYPYLRVKRRQADVAFQFATTLRPNGIGRKRGLPPDVLEEREALAVAMSALNRPGVSHGYN